MLKRKLVDTFSIKSVYMGSEQEIEEALTNLIAFLNLSKCITITSVDKAFSPAGYSYRLYSFPQVQLTEFMQGCNKLQNFIHDIDS